MQVILVYRPELVLGDDGIDEPTPFDGIEIVTVLPNKTSEEEALQVIDNFKDECLRFNKQPVINEWRFHIESV